MKQYPIDNKTLSTWCHVDLSSFQISLIYQALRISCEVTGSGFPTDHIICVPRVKGPQALVYSARRKGGSLTNNMTPILEHWNLLPTFEEQPPSVKIPQESRPIKQGHKSWHFLLDLRKATFGEALLFEFCHPFKIGRHIFYFIFNIPNGILFSMYLTIIRRNLNARTMRFLMVGFHVGCSLTMI